MKSTSKIDPYHISNNIIYMVSVSIYDVVSNCLCTLGTSPFDMEASVCDPNGASELCDVMDLEDFHYKIMFTPKMDGIHTLSIRHKAMHVSGTKKY